MPFFAFTINQVAGNHFSNPKGESSKIVPTLTLNCFLHPRQFQMRRGSIRLLMSVEPQRGHETPSGQRISVRNSWQVSASEKWRIAPVNVSGIWSDFALMNERISPMEKCVKYIITA